MEQPQEDDINFMIERSGRKPFVFQSIKTQQTESLSRNTSFRKRSHSVESSVGHSDSTGNSDEELSSGSSPRGRSSPTGSDTSRAGSEGSSGNNSEEDKDYPSLFLPSEAFTYARDSYPLRDNLARCPLRPSQRWVRDHKDLKVINKDVKVINKDETEEQMKQYVEYAAEKLKVPQPITPQKTLVEVQATNTKARLQIIGGGKTPLKGARKIRVPYARDSYPSAKDLRRKPLYHNKVTIKEKKEDDFALKYIPIYQEVDMDEKVSKSSLRDHKNLKVIDFVTFEFIPVYQEAPAKKIRNKDSSSSAKKTIQNQKIPRDLEMLNFKYIPVYQEKPLKKTNNSSISMKKTVRDQQNLQKITHAKKLVPVPSTAKKVTFNYIPVYQEEKENSASGVKHAKKSLQVETRKISEREMCGSS